MAVTKRKIRHRRGSVRLESRIAIRRKHIWVPGELPEIRAKKPHEYRNMAAAKNAEGKSICNLTHCAKPVDAAIHRF